MVKSQTYDPVPSYPYGLCVLLLDKAISLFDSLLGAEDAQVDPVAWCKGSVQGILLEDGFEKLDFEVGSFISVTLWYILNQNCEGVGLDKEPP